MAAAVELGLVGSDQVRLAEVVLQQTDPAAHVLVLGMVLEPDLEHNDLWLVQLTLADVGCGMSCGGLYPSG